MSQSIHTPSKTGQTGISTETHFLGKAGKIHGPFSKREFDQMIAEGKLGQFTWIWDWKERSWKTIELPPPPIPYLPGAAEPLASAASPSAGAPTGLQHPQRPSLNPNHGTNLSANLSSEWSILQAICFNRVALMKGMLSFATETGCTLISSSQKVRSLFPLESSAELNLYDEKSKKSASVLVEVAGVQFTKEGDTYQLKWKDKPDFCRT